MKKLLIAVVMTLGIAISFDSCKKYEEGPAVSLLTKKARLSGEWTVEKYLYNEQDQTSLFTGLVGASYVWEIEKDGSFKETGNVNTSGTWSLGEDKDDITFTPANGTAVTYRILKLKSKELWLRHTESNGDIEKLYLKQ
jgi:hypothetical protein